MPRISFHLPERRGPRENDVGFLIAETQQRGLFVRKLGGQQVELVSTRKQNVLFTGSVPAAVTYLRERLARRHEAAGGPG